MSTASGWFWLVVFFDEMFSEINSFWGRIIISAEQRRIILHLKREYFFRINLTKKSYFDFII